MAAIVGIVSKRAEPIGVPLVKMLQKLSHRGPTLSGVWINGKTEISKKIAELDVSKMDGDIGIGTNTLARDKHDIKLRTLDGGSFILDGEMHDASDVLHRLSIEKTFNIEKLSKYLNNCFNGSEILSSSKQIVEELNGGFSFAAVLENKLILARDVIGIKPLFIGENEDYIAFASEKKALWEIGLTNGINPILPGEGVVISQNNINRNSFLKRLDNTRLDIELEDCERNVLKLLNKSIDDRIKNNEVALLFSGGLDSSIIAKILKDMKVDVQLFCACFNPSKDLKNSIRTAKQLGLPISVIELTDEKILAELDRIIYHLEDSDTVTAEIATPFYFATKLAKSEGFSSIFAGQGADELFAGYSRYMKLQQDLGYKGLHDALFNDVLNLWHKNLQRDDRICMANSVELELPYLDNELVEYSLRIPPEFKLRNEAGELIRKYILRKVGSQIKLDPEIVSQPKLAVQYGSGSSRSFKRISNILELSNDIIKKYGFNSDNELLLNLIAYKLGFPEDEFKNIKGLGELVSKYHLISKL